MLFGCVVEIIGGLLMLRSLCFRLRCFVCCLFDCCDGCVVGFARAGVRVLVGLVLWVVYVTSVCLKVSVWTLRWF